MYEMLHWSCQRTMGTSDCAMNAGLCWVVSRPRNVSRASEAEGDKRNNVA